jgi:hypothetical protein
MSEAVSNAKPELATPQLDERKHVKPELAKLELWLASALTLAAGYLHLTFLLRAGGLWRDEVVSFNVATQPTLAQVHEAVRYDSFPSLYHLLLRAWMSLGWGESDDLAPRGLGLVIGCAVLAVLWWNARTFSARVPLLSLLLLGISGLCVRTTDSVRAYGIGLVCIALCFGLIWKVASQPSRQNVILAALAAIGAVQSMYQNAFLLAAICLAGVAVCARHQQWRRAAAILGIGGTAALSLTLYLGAMQHMGEIKQLIAARAGFGRILVVALAALRDGSNLRLALWLLLLVGFLGLGFRALRALARSGALTRAAGAELDPAEDVIVYALSSVVVAVAGFLLWLRMLGFPTQPWYYVPPMSLLCLAADATWPVLLTQRRAAIVRLSAVSLAGLLGFASAYSTVKIRQTNVDLLAERLGQLAQPGDFILVDQWYNGATFSRYFNGATPWTTLPPLEDQSLQRLDLFKQYMVALKPTAPVEQQIENTLRAGHRVWLAGGLPLSKQGNPAPELPPAPNSPVGWDHDAYSYVWARKAGELLQKGAEKSGQVDLKLQTPVSEYENLPLWVVQGWKSEQGQVLRP